MKKRVAALALAAALLVVLIPDTLRVPSASAANTLPQIAEIGNKIKSGSAFTILEIVPETGTGSIGYYVSGYEPGTNWRAVIAGYDSRTARTSYMNNYFQGLQNSGIMGGGGLFPLTSVAGYSELYPWETGPDYEELKLNQTETVTLDNFAARPAADGEPGDLFARYEYTLDTSSGTYIQDALYYAYIGEHIDNKDESADRTYTYNATFSSVDETVELKDGLALYEKEAVTIPPPPDSGEPEVVFDYYTYAGTLGQGYYLDVLKEYYYLSEIGEPLEESAEGIPGGVYAPVLNGKSDGFRTVADGGYFSNWPTGQFLYTPSGGGDYVLEPSPGASDSITVAYDNIQIKGGYSNNDWFLKYVMNLENGDLSPGKTLSDLSIVVRSVRAGADELTGEAVENADLIVLSAGLRPNGAAVAGYGGAIDVSSEVAEAIYKKASLSYQIPVVVDFRIAADTTGSNMQKLARFFVGTGANGYSITADDMGTEKTFASETIPVPSGTSQNRVNRNFYIYTPTSGAEPGFTALANSSFYKSFLSAAGFQDIIDEINYENFLLQNENAGASLLTPEASMANAVRYIINYGEGRVRSVKTSFRVLELQGGSASVLTPATVLGWLPADSGITAANITVVTMSTNEFVGKIEDLNETYDMVYVGGSTTGLSSTSGLVYYNVGDQMTIDKNLAGLLDSEYTSGARQYIKNSNLYTRKPGNDITPTKAQSIIDFAASGYPVVIEDTLFTGTSSTEDEEFDVNITSSGSGGSFALSAAVTNSLDGSAMTGFTYQWYRGTNSNGSGASSVSGATNATYAPSNSSTNYYYYCVVRRNQSGSAHVTDARSNLIQVRSRVNQGSTNNGKQPGKSTKSVTVYKSESSLNGNLVDNCTNLFETVNNIKSRRNVISVTEAKSDPVLLLNYLNLSKPKLVMTQTPVAYSNNSGVMTSISSDASGRYFLNYTFRIENQTDATPDKTTYDIGLYYDQNGDGRYIGDEKLSDVTIRRADNNQLILPDGSMAYSLRAGVTYTLEREVDVRGILPWKLSAVKNSAPHIHTSEVGYTRIAAEASEITPIKVLQLLPTAQYGSITVDLSTSSTYQNLLTEIPDFNIQFKVIYCDGREKTGSNRLWASGANAAAIYDVLKYYDMLVIGFADCYDGLNSAAASAIISYIESGRAVLFTHDLTSIQNVSNSNITISGTSTKAYTEQAWGYYFNTILRDYASMDTYGITSQAQLNSTTTIASLLQKSGLSTSANAQTIQNAGYSVAYTPKSAKNTYLEYTQGYSAYALGRWGGGAGNPSTTTVSQVNSGKITTYPFNINTKAFDSSMSRTSDLTVASTHGQYYTLNLNSEDIVVWYTLSGSGYSSKNDVVNNYYIFNKGNITYSGVGHSSGVTTDEAKLFLNTMIAAYRAAAKRPEIKLTNEKSVETDRQYFFVPEEASPDADEFLDRELSMPFIISDINLDPAKSIEITVNYDCVKYTAAGRSIIETKSFTAPEYNIKTTAGTAATNGNLSPNIMYRLYFPQSMLNRLLDNHEIVISASVTTTLSSGETLESVLKSLALRKIELKDLS